LVISKITGGLGNQMFQYAIAKSIARRNNDNFTLDTSFYPKQTLRKYELNLFNIEKFLPKSENIIYKSLKKIRLNSRNYYVEKNISEYDDNVFKYKKNIFLDGYWQNEKYFKDIKDEIIKDFTKTYATDNESKLYLKQIINLNSVSIHVRRGDYINDHQVNKNHGICDLEYYKKTIEYLNSNFNNLTYIIFSDDMDWCKDNFNFLADKIFIDNTKTALDDLELMKNCKHNIIANSTFSWWGAWLNENQNKIVIAPKRWFLKSEWVDKNIACNGWIKI
jgi:hypothetical protein